jgi:hypothetical protein
MHWCSKKIARKFGALTMLTTAERDLVQAANMAMDRLDRATAPVEIAKARAELERIRGKLEKARDPNAQALQVMRKALAQPIDAATGALVKAKPSSQKATAGRSDRFDKLMRPAGAAALAK